MADCEKQHVTTCAMKPLALRRLLLLCPPLCCPDNPEKTRPQMEVSNPKRVLAVSLADEANHLRRVIRGTTNPALSRWPRRSAICSLFLARSPA